MSWAVLFVSNAIVWYSVLQRYSNSLQPKTACCVTTQVMIYCLSDERAPVAQLDRVFDYESKGHRFESCRAHHENPLSKPLSGLFVCWLRRLGGRFGHNLVT
jgi:hypothetical protein